MEALVWEAPCQMQMRTWERPVARPDEVVIKVAYAGICGSELSGYLGHNALRVPPLIMGHEFAGEVVALGSRVLDSKAAPLTVGQRVTVNPMVFCGTCEFCAGRGLNQFCIDRTLIGAHRPGAFAEFVSVPARQVMPLPPEVSLRQAALTEPVACCVRVSEVIGPVDGKDVLVLGAGPIGLLTLQILRRSQASGGRVFIVDLNADRLAMGAALGGEALNPQTCDIVETVRAATGGRGVHVAIDAVGTSATRHQCVAATRTRGTVVLVGLHEEASTMPVADMIRREITVRSSFCYTPANFAAALSLLAADAVRLDPWVIEAPLSEGGAWFERLVDGPGDVAKVLLIPQ
jgi:threonine dehydrogenase-like Zn-dependent dehydrogenase